MGLSCDCNWEASIKDHDWVWYMPRDFSKYKQKRGKKCCSCGDMVRTGDICGYIERVRRPTDFEEIKLNFDEVFIASWVWCEECTGLAFSLSDLGYCFNIEDHIPTLVKDHIKMQELAK